MGALAAPSPCPAPPGVAGSGAGCQHLVGGQPADAMLAQERHHGSAPQPSCGGGRGGEPQERPKPGFVGGGAEGERLRIKPVELLAQPTGQAPPLLAQLILDPRPLPQLNDQGILGRERPEGRRSVARAVASTSASRRSSLAPATCNGRGSGRDCLGLSAKTWKPRSSSVSTTAPRGTSSATATRAGSPPRELRQPLGEGLERHGLMSNGALAQWHALGVEHGDLVSNSAPINADVQRVRSLRHRASFARPAAPRRSRRTLYWRLARNSPQDIPPRSGPLGRGSVFGA